MAKNILTLPLDSLQKEVRSLPWKKIRSLLVAIYEFKWEHLRGLPDEMVHDTERRESILEGELVRRGIMTAENRQDFRKLVAHAYRRKSF